MWNLKKVDFSTPQGRNALFDAVQLIFDAPSQALAMVRSGNVKEFSDASQWPAAALQILQQFQLGIEDIDQEYLAAFQVLDFTQTTEEGFEILDMEGGLTFSKVLDGESIKYYSVAGSKASIGFDMYGGGLQWSRKWFDDQKWWKLEQTSLEFSRKWWRDKAKVYYGLVQALTNHADYNVVYDVTAGASQVYKDIKTLNAGAAELIEAHKTTGITVNPGTTFVVLCPSSMLERARAAQKGVPSTSTLDGAQLNYNFDFHFSSHIDMTADATGTDWVGHVVDAKAPLGYMAVPRAKNQIGERMALRIYPPEFDVSRYSELVAAWGRHGGAINLAQWRRLLSA